MGGVVVGGAVQQQECSGFTETGRVSHTGYIGQPKDILTRELLTFLRYFLSQMAKNHI